MIFTEDIHIKKFFVKVEILRRMRSLMSQAHKSSTIIPTSCKKIIIIIKRGIIRHEQQLHYQRSDPIVSE